MEIKLLIIGLVLLGILSFIALAILAGLFSSVNLDENGLD